MKRSALSGVALLAIAGVVASLATLGAQAHEWEGYPENPLAEARGADEYLARQPASPIAPYLHLFIAHRQYCAATLLPPSSPERRRALARFRSEVGIARQARHPLIRFVATDLARRPDCWTDL